MTAMQETAPDVVGDLARAVRLVDLEAAVAKVAAVCAGLLLVLALAAIMSVAHDEMTGGDGFLLTRCAR